MSIYMNLAPTDASWVDLLAAVGVCVWIVAIGAFMAHATFARAGRLIWPCYSPILGFLAVLLTTNLVAYVIPGAAAAWVGLLVPTAISTVIAWRSGALARISRGSVISLLALATASSGVFLFALANRTHVWFTDETWHFPLALRLARGVFPPATPYGPDAGIGYHYGYDLVAATIISTTGAPPWAAFYVLMSFLVVTLILAAAGFAYHIGAPLPLAAGIGATVGMFSGRFNVGLPPYFEPSAPASNFATFLAGLAPAQTAHPDARLAFEWLDAPQRMLALAAVILVAAAFESGVTHRRAAAAMAAGGGVLALAESSVLIFAAAALALVGVVRFVKLHRRDRLVLAAALATSALLIVFAGGSISDELFGRGGSTGMVRIYLDLRRADLLLFALTGPALVRVGIIPLIAVGAIVAFRRRSWGLGYLSAAGALGFVAAELVHSPLPMNDGRIIQLAMAVAILAALSGVGWLVGRLHGWRRFAAALGLALFVILPTVLPRTISGARLASSGIEIGYPNTLSLDRDLNRSQLGPELAKNWDFYGWLARSLPNDARLLTPFPSVSASVAGIASPTSGRDLQALSPIVMPVHEDTLRFLSANDLADMSITHLHVTDALEDALTPSARRLLDDPAHFKLLTDMRSVSGMRHRVFEVLPGAGTTQIEPASFRFLREIVPPNAPISLVRALSLYQRRMILLTLVDHDYVRAPGTLASTFVNRATRLTSFETISVIPERGVVVLPDFVEPVIALSLPLGEAIWAGYGMRAYDLSSAWSTVWRIGPDPAGLPAHLSKLCESATQPQFELKVLGESGTTMTIGRTKVKLTGVPQSVQLSIPDCGEFALAADADVPPFVQIRPYRHTAGHVERESHTAGLGFDGGTDGDRAVVNLWYRNPHGLKFVTGTELRLYKADADAAGLVPVQPDPSRSLRWWSDPIFLTPDTQMTRIEFDARRLEINGEAGAGERKELVSDGTYLLTLNVAGADPATGYSEIQHLIPLLRFTINDDGVSYSVFSGIVTIKHRKPGTIATWLSRRDWLGWELDRTPR